jgi:hypothetical protein
VYTPAAIDFRKNRLFIKPPSLSIREHLDSHPNGGFMRRADLLGVSSSPSLGLSFYLHAARKQWPLRHLVDGVPGKVGI